MGVGEWASNLCLPCKTETGGESKGEIPYLPHPCLSPPGGGKVGPEALRVEELSLHPGLPCGGKGKMPSFLTP